MRKILLKSKSSITGNLDILEKKIQLLLICKKLDTINLLVLKNNKNKKILLRKNLIIGVIKNDNRYKMKLANTILVSISFRSNF